MTGNERRYQTALERIVARRNRHLLICGVMLLYGVSVGVCGLLAGGLIGLAGWVIR